MVYLDSLPKFSLATISQKFNVKIAYSEKGTAQILVNNQVPGIKKDGKGRYCFVVGGRNYKYLFLDLDGKLKAYTQIGASFLTRSLNKDIRKLLREVKAQIKQIS